MKKIQAMLGAALCGVLLSVGANASAQAAKSCYATVVRVEGQVSYSLGDNVWHPLVPGKYLPPGSSIRTGDNGVVDVILAHDVELPQAKRTPDRISAAVDGPVRGLVSYKPSVEQNAVRLTPGTLLTIDKLTTTDTGADTVSDTELNLKKGKIFATVKKISGASQYLVKIPNGIAGVRGTQFSITAEGVVVVFQTHDNNGLLMSLTLPDGSTKTWLIDNGQSFDPVSGQLSPIPTNVIGTLREIFYALSTVYVQVVNFDFDRTQEYVSNNHGKHKGNGNGNGNGPGGGTPQ